VPKGIKAEERQPIWFRILPLVAYTGFLMTAAAWTLASSLAPEIGGLACVVLLVAALLLDHDADHHQPTQLTK